LSLVLADRLSVDLGGARVLSGATLAIEAGETLALVGPNAAGKSTLLRALAGLLPASDGAVVLEGRPLPLWGRRALARTVALVTAEDQGPDTLQVFDRVALGRYPHLGPFKTPSDHDRRAVAAALERVGIRHLQDRRLGTLSEGERQLASLARGLAQEAAVLLLDEPASHLDVGHELHLFSILDEVAQQGVAVLAVVHDLQRAAAWASRMALVHEGRIAAQGAPLDVLTSAECARAFSVQIRSHALPGLPHPLYTFESVPGRGETRREP
jgi:iron complex transport system ATP-binding protein